MLFIVLVLVLAALGLLITALITASSLWAWISIGLSVVAGLLLVVDWVRRRVGRRRQAAVAEPEDEPSAEAATSAGDDDVADEPVTAETADEPAEQATAVAEAGEPADQTALIPAAGELVGTAEEGEPGEERTDEADAKIVDELDVEVVVVDEHPRYHLTDCGWLADRDVIPISVSEARDLGFTPCARCTPDAHLAQAHRAKKKSKA
ncbi:hypothetical protein [Amycolatopsis thermophila]|uniref:Uncharacterized protein n=1 Tax=Amycolatopsis thermophila TaxID=206084 RepID=A0ABU0F409_9PSEU|nr:hypothetical protein [Amycolatopsis thermophila]MDQ0382321.1 hypothetical protein [Amycolatopsis thermophila]